MATSLSQSSSSKSQATSPTVGRESDGITKRDVIDAAQKALDVVESFTDSLPFVSIVVNALRMAVDVVDQCLENNDDMKDLMSRIDQIKTDLQNRRPGKAVCESKPEALTYLEETIKRVTSDLHKIQDSNTVLKALKADNIATKIKTYLDEIGQALDRYHRYLNQETHDTVEDIRGDQLLNQLRKSTASLAMYSSGLPGCMENTRTGILEELRQWASNPSSPQVYWLNGYAGSGKTAIAQSFANMLRSQGQLGASLFCSRESLDRGDVVRILPTLSLQLADLEPRSFRSALIEVLETVNGSLAASWSFDDQLERLIINPSQKSKLSTVILIDALDECHDTKRMLELLSQLIKGLSPLSSIKLFITSSRDIHIKNVIAPNISTWIDKELHTVSGAEQDIKLFISTELARTTSDRPDIDIPLDWPGEKSVDELVRKASGLFIFASTVVKAVKAEGYDPVERLEQLTDDTNNLKRRLFQSRGTRKLDNPYTGLDKLYLRILEIAFPPENEDQLSNLRSILGLLAIACEPLAPTIMTELLSESPTRNTITSILHLLHPFLRVPGKDEEEGPVAFAHKSFLDFLTNPQRCKDQRFHIDISEHHLYANKSCFDLMGNSYSAIGKNICGLSRYSFNGDCDNLSTAKRNENMSEGLKYCCRYWVNHVLATDSSRKEPLASTIASLSSFLGTASVLWWYEALSLMREPELRRASEALDTIHKWLTSMDESNTGKYNDLIRWVDEGRKFLSFAFEVAQESVAHIYHSALPFCPTQSLYHQFADTFAATEAKIIIGADESWPGAGPETRPKITFAHFSLDGTLVISGTQDQTTRIWDTTDGTSSAILREHSSKFKDGTFLSNNTYVVCYADNGSLILWDRTKANVCDQDITTYKEHGYFHQIFPSTHRPLGFFTTHTLTDPQTGHANWSVCYWEVIQEGSASQRVAETRPGPRDVNAQLRLLAYGSIPLYGGFGVACIHHQVSSDTAGSMVTVEFKSGRHFAASGPDLDTTTSHPSNVTFMSFTNTKEPTEGTPASRTARDPRTYFDSESPCLQSDDRAWIMVERSRRILWVPPSHRGEHGRWWKKDKQRKLLLEGENGRLTVVDFSRVDMDSDVLF